MMQTANQLMAFIKKESTLSTAKNLVQHFQQKNIYLLNPDEVTDEILKYIMPLTWMKIWSISTNELMSSFFGEESEGIVQRLVLMKYISLMPPTTLPRSRDLPSEILRLTARGRKFVDFHNQISHLYKHKTRQKFDTILHDLLVQQHTIDIIKSMKIDSIHPAPTTKNKFYINFGYDAVLINSRLKFGLELERSVKSTNYGLKKARKILDGVKKWPKAVAPVDTEDWFIQTTINEYNNKWKNQMDAVVIICTGDGCYRLYRKIFSLNIESSQEEKLRTSDHLTNNRYILSDNKICLSQHTSRNVFLIDLSTKGV